MPTPGRLYKFKDGSSYQVLFIANDINTDEYKIVYRGNKNPNKIFVCDIIYWKIIYPYLKMEVELHGK